MNQTLRSDPIIAIVAIAAVMAAYLFAIPKPITQAKPNNQAGMPAPREAGNLIFSENFYDFGNATEGDTLRHTVMFKNVGKTPVKILSTSSSCGCTTTNTALKSYAPDEEGSMEIVVDTVGKKGVVVKTVTITTDSPKTPTIELSLSMTLTPKAHPVKEALTNLNTDARCKSCHLESAKGQSGIFLYHRICAQCHGKKGAGASAMALNDAKWQDGINDEHIRQIIKQGLPAAHMPSFVDGVTPPLQEEQVDSLVKYLRQIKQ